MGFVGITNSSPNPQINKYIFDSTAKDSYKISVICDTNLNDIIHDKCYAELLKKSKSAFRILGGFLIKNPSLILALAYNILAVRRLNIKPCKCQ